MVSSRNYSAHVLAPERHIFLSPHYDDIALSAGGTAALVASAGKQADIALVFGSEPDPSQPLSVFAEEMHRWECRPPMSLPDVAPRKPPLR
ncbi:MAG: hypothetical protein R2845_13310 [Thermomicrobiales bacterium]